MSGRKRKAVSITGVVTGAVAALARDDQVDATVHEAVIEPPAKRCMLSDTAVSESQDNKEPNTGEDDEEDANEDDDEDEDDDEGENAEQKARDALIEKQLQLVLDQGQHLINEFLPKLLPSGPLTMDQLRSAQQAYASNPDRRWVHDPATFKCEYDDRGREDLVWKTTQKVAAMIMTTRDVRSYEAVLKAVEAKEIDLKYVDCYLPAYRDVGNVYCNECSFGGRRPLNDKTALERHYRKLSLLRIWAGSARLPTLDIPELHQTVCGTVEHKNWDECPYASLRPILYRTYSDDHFATNHHPARIHEMRVMDRFMREVLLPTGLATRYNEGFNCRNANVLEFAIDLCNAFQVETSQAEFQMSIPMLLLYAFPAPAMMNISKSIVGAEYRGDVLEEIPLWRKMQHIKIFPRVHISFMRLKLAAQKQFNVTTSKAHAMEVLHVSDLAALVGSYV